MCTPDHHGYSVVSSSNICSSWLNEDKSLYSQAKEHCFSNNTLAFVYFWQCRECTPFFLLYMSDL